MYWDVDTWNPNAFVISFSPTLRRDSRGPRGGTSLRMSLYTRRLDYRSFRKVCMCGPRGFSVWRVGTFLDSKGCGFSFVRIVTPSRLPASVIKGGEEGQILGSVSSPLHGVGSHVGYRTEPVQTRTEPVGGVEERRYVGVWSSDGNGRRKIDVWG